MSSNDGVPVQTPGNPPPDKFSLSAPFATLLAGFVVESNDDGEQFIIHEECGLGVTQVEHADSIEVLLRTVINHDC